MKRILNTEYRLLVAVSFFATALVSCKSDPLSPGVEFMPDMYRSPSYETYSENSMYPDSMASRKPVDGTIPRGYMPYTNPDNNEGYAVSDSLKMPAEFSTPASMEEGKRLYGIYCTHCHGASGMGDGMVAQKLPGPPPAYSSPQLKNLSEGKMFHSVTYGKNLMGPHGSQLSAGERWKIITYIKTLQNPSAGSAPADTTAKK